MNVALLKELSDEELVALAREESSGVAVIELMNRVSGFIGYKAAQFAGFDSQDKQDFQQQGLIGVLNAIRTYDAGKGAKFSTYACRSAINSMISLYEQQNKKSVPTVALESLYSAEGMTDTYDELSSYEAVEEIAEKIKTRLSDFERAVLAIYLRGGSYSQIAAQTGKSVKSIDNAVQRIRRKLKAD
ncbi:MAG: sigma-70 family RNA polymerase sigma factor [Clostridia bacterium]|nr:sigma-70 family RNA polymerase sigma factor [Clostridia bacterium]